MQDVMTRAKMGDGKAIEDVLRRAEPLVRHVARQYSVPGMDREDLEQEARIALWEALRDYRPDAGAAWTSFAWLCMRRRIVRLLRRSVRKDGWWLLHVMPMDTTWDGDEEHGVCPPVAGDGPLPEELYFDRCSALQRVEEIAHALSGRERDVVRLYAMGLSYKEIARTLGMPLKSVDNAMQRARVKASRLLALR